MQGFTLVCRTFGAMVIILTCLLVDPILQWAAWQTIIGEFPFYRFMGFVALNAFLLIGGGVFLMFVKCSALGGNGYTRRA